MPGDNSSDSVWIEQALERFERPLFRYALRLIGDPDAARDVVQDTFLRLCRAERQKVEAGLAAWLYTVCRNRALDLVRREKRMGRLGEAATKAPADQAGGPAADTERQQLGALVAEALGTLSDQHQEAFRLKFQDDLSYREIGRVMGVSLGQVSKLIAVALVAVRDRMRERGALAREG
jgi:RNA polymerase sigma-70 factor (ECF subfamily)